MTTRTLEWAARVAADATDRRVSEAGRDQWTADDRRWYKGVLNDLCFTYRIERIAL